METPNTDREQQALDWVRRIADADFGDWDGHLRWLEADNRNASLFDRVSLEMEATTEGLAPAGPAAGDVRVANDNDAGVRRLTWRAGGAFGGVIAAGIAAIILWSHQPAGPTASVVATAPGSVRTVTLADGTRVTLNGASRLSIDGSRSAELVAGEGFFEVTHHPDDPFRLQVGSRVIEDVGTAFDVAIAPQTTRVAVSDGAVAVDPQTVNLRLTAGQGARFDTTGEIVRTTVTQDHAIGGWREGRLVYQGASWTEVVTDLSRSLGTSVAVSPDLGSRRFTGVIILDHDKATTIKRFADVAGVSVVRDGQGWRLTAR